MTQFPDNGTSPSAPFPDGHAGPPPLPAKQGREVARWRWWAHLLILAAYPLVIGGMAYFHTGPVEPALGSSVKGLLLISGVEMAVFGAIFGIAWFASRANAVQLLIAGPFHPRDIPLGLAYSIGLRLGIALVIAIIAGMLVAFGAISVAEVQDFVSQNRPNVESLVDVKALANNPLYMFLNATLVSFVVAGLREELWRAGVLAGLKVLWPGRFGSTAGQILAVATAAVLFGVGHFSQGLLAVLLTGVLGFLLGLIMVFHKSIWPAVVAHGAFNATSFIVLPWAMEHLSV